MSWLDGRWADWLATWDGWFDDLLDCWTVLTCLFFDGLFGWFFVCMINSFLVG